MPSGVYVRDTNNAETKTPLYKLWINVKTRCNNPNADNYKYYGGRGIKMCYEWSQYFFSFKTWCIKNGYNKGLSLDRIKPDGDYSPDNCRFTTAKEQARNRRNNIFLEYNGMKKCLSEWAEYLGLNDFVVLGRYNRGLPIEKILHPKKLTNQYK